MADLESMQNDATAYGGRFSGFDPAYSDQVGGEAIYTPSVDDNMFSFDSGLGDMFSEYGSGYSPSYGVYGEASSPNTTPSEQFFSWADDKLQKNPLAALAASFIPGVGKVLGGYQAARNLSKGNYMQGAGQVMGLAGVPGAGVLNAGYNASKGNYSGIGSLAGGIAAGAPGAAVGGMIGRGMSGGTPGFNPNAGGVPNQTDSNGLNIGALAGGLMDLYGNRGGGNISGAAANNQAVSQQIQNLGSMYGPNSPYAQQLRQELERKDAKAGRRSQYGPREVQLQAALADKAASVSDSMGRLAQTNQANQIALQDRKRLQTGQNLATLMQMGQKSGLFNGLQGMFSGGGGNAAPAIEQYPVYDTADYGGGF